MIGLGAHWGSIVCVFFVSRSHGKTAAMRISGGVRLPNRFRIVHRKAFAHCAAVAGLFAYTVQVLD